MIIRGDTQIFEWGCRYEMSFQNMEHFVMLPLFVPRRSWHTSCQPRLPIKWRKFRQFKDTRLFTGCAQQMQYFIQQYSSKIELGDGLLFSHIFKDFVCTKLADLRPQLSHLVQSVLSVRQWKLEPLCGSLMVEVVVVVVVVYLHDSSNIQMPIQKKNHANKVLKEVRNL